MPPEERNGRIDLLAAWLTRVESKVDQLLSAGYMTREDCDKHMSEVYGRLRKTETVQTGWQGAIKVIVPVLTMAGGVIVGRLMNLIP